MATELRLAIELVPEPLWNFTPRQLMGRSNWDRLQKEVIAKFGYRCSICKAEGRLDAHEIWEYDDKNLLQKLGGFMALCRECHLVKHIGRTGNLAGKGTVDMEQIIGHFITVNGCTRKVFDEHYQAALETWRKRSARKGWTRDWGEFQHFVSDRDPAS